MKANNMRILQYIYELSMDLTCAENVLVQSEGSRKIKFYNFDMIIFVGYRVKSKRGITFRKWATSILRII